MCRRCVRGQYLMKGYYLENDKIIFTPEHHIKRGRCCGNGCRHCPYEPLHIKDNIQLQSIYVQEVSKESTDTGSSRSTSR